MNANQSSQRQYCNFEMDLKSSNIPLHGFGEQLFFNIKEKGGDISWEACLL